MDTGRRSGLKLENTMLAFVLALLLPRSRLRRHRGSVCTRAVAESACADLRHVLSSGKSMLWIVTLTLPAFVLSGDGELGKRLVPDLCPRRVASGSGPESTAPAY
jgi:hypothetical protein